MAFRIITIDLLNNVVYILNIILLDLCKVHFSKAIWKPHRILNLPCLLLFLSSYSMTQNTWIIVKHISFWNHYHFSFKLVYYNLLRSAGSCLYHQFWHQILHSSTRSVLMWYLLFLDAFVKLRKANISLILSARLSVHPRRTTLLTPNGF
jgi:hypothetical protein